VSDIEQPVQCEVLTDNGQTVEDSSGYSDTEPTDGAVLGTDRHKETLENISGPSDTQPTHSRL
jgi:hypothetical protein